MPEIRCFEDMDQFGAETADELEDLTQDLYHRLIEEPGSNPDDPDRGLGFGSILSAAVGSSFYLTLGPRIEHELSKDKRVSAVSAKVTTLETGSYRVAILVVANETELGFALEIDASGVVRRVASNDGTFR